MSRRPSRAASSEEQVYTGRIAALRRGMDQHGVSSMLVTDPQDVAYLTGFLGGDSYLYVPPSGKPWIVSDDRYREDLDAFGGILRLAMRSGPMLGAIAKLLGMERDAGRLDLAAGSLGVQAEHLTVAQQAAFGTALKAAKLPARLPTPVTGIVTRLRERKDDLEVRLITRAVRLQEEAFEATLEQIGPGMNELEITAILEYEMKARGSTKPGFTTIVAAEPNGSRPHYVPAAGVTKRGGTLLVDWGAIHRGYHGDMTRVVAFGRWPPEIREIYEIVLDAHEAAASALRPGVTTAEVDRAARDHIARAGYGEYFGHGLGHGLGLDIHEGPRLSHMVEGVEVEPGQVFTIEPGIYLPGVGGVRIEDDYVVTERGRRNLCRLPKDLAWATR